MTSQPLAFILLAAIELTCG